MGPDLVIVNGTVLTVDAADRQVEAVAVTAGRISALGTTSEISALRTSATSVIDLEGRTLIPGLTDSHVHLADSALPEMHSVELRDTVGDTDSIAKILDRLRAAASSVPAGRWILAMGSPLQDGRLAERRLPRREELDAAAPQHPVMMTFGAHITVANTSALTLAGITASTPSPDGGRIEIDPATGALTGLLLEAAQRPVGHLAGAKIPMGHNPDTPLEDVKAAICWGAQRAVARGVTSIHEIVTTAVSIRAYQELALAGALPLRVSLLIRVINGYIHGSPLTDLGLVTGFGDDWLRIGGVKISIDGGATGKAALFYEPYPGTCACNCGILRVPADQLDELVDRYHRAGHRVCIHAMGDRAMDMALDAIEKAIEKTPRADHRHRVEHLGNWLISDERLARIVRNTILPVPNMSFMHFLLRSFESVLGPERLEHAFPLKTLFGAGIPVTTGSDGSSYWRIDPLRDLGTAVSRQTRDGTISGLDEALTPAQALRMSTRNAAYNGFDEQRKGSIEVGKLADLAVLAANPYLVAPAEIGSIDVDATIIDGRVVYQRRGAEVAV